MPQGTKWPNPNRRLRHPRLFFLFFGGNFSFFFTQKQFDVIHRVCNNIIRIRTSVQEAGWRYKAPYPCVYIFLGFFLFSPFAIICVYFSCTLIIIIYNNNKKSSRIFSAVVCVTRGASIDADSLIITKKNTHTAWWRYTYFCAAQSKEWRERRKSSGEVRR